MVGMNSPAEQSGARLVTDGSASEAEALQQVVESLRDRLTKLSQASIRIIQNLDLDTVLQEIVDNARLLTGASHCSPVTFNGSGSVDKLVNSGVPEEDLEQVEAWFRSSSSLYWLNLLTEPLRLSNLPGYLPPTGFPNTSMDLQTFMGMPIHHLDSQIGAIYLSEKEDGKEFTSEDEEIMVWFASQSAMAITNARRYAEEQRAKASLEALVDTSPVGVAVFDPKTMSYTLANQERKRMSSRIWDSGRSMADILKVITLKRPDGSEMSQEDMPSIRALNTGETVRAEEIVIHFPEGPPVTVLANSAPVFSEDGEITSVVSTLQDMTPLEDLLRQRSEFLGMVSHELRTPLTTVIGATAAALDPSTTVDTAELLQFFRIIDEQAGRMRRLINDLLDLTRIDAGLLSITPQPVDVAALVEEARNVFLRSGARNDVEVDLPPDLPRVNADGQRMLQVLNNLLSNASRNSPEQSAIQVSASVEDVHVAVSISDQGRGINAQRLLHLFERSSLTDRENRISGTQGNGLGLAICKEIVEAHGGRIWADSAGEGLGARFTFTIPTADEVVPNAVPGLARSAADSGSAPRERVRILAVDDELQVLRYIRNTLSQAGYITITTVNPNEAPHLIETENPHLILLDLMLPGTDGIELMKRILRITDVPVIFVSGHGEDRSIERAFGAGADDYIVKPFSPNELVARIEVVLRRHTSSERARTRQPYVLDDLCIDYTERRVTVAGHPPRLTATEYKLLYELSINAGRVLDHNHLLRRVWGPNHFGDSRLVRTFIKKLRHKLRDDASNPKYIITEPRVGYRMEQPDAPERGQKTG